MVTCIMLRCASRYSQSSDAVTSPDCAVGKVSAVAAGSGVSVGLGVSVAVGVTPSRCGSSSASDPAGDGAQPTIKEAVSIVIKQKERVLFIDIDLSRRVNAAEFTRSRYIYPSISP